MERNNGIEAMRSLGRVNSLLVKRMKREKGINGQSFALLYLGAHEKRAAAGESCCPLNQAMVADASGITPQSVGALLTSLECRGLIEREPSPEDRRSLKVTLTPAGREEADRIHQVLVDFSQEALSCLDDSEKKELARLLGKLSDSLSEGE